MAEIGLPIGRDQISWASLAGQDLAQAAEKVGLPALVGSDDGRDVLLDRNFNKAEFFAILPYAGGVPGPGDATRAAIGIVPKADVERFVAAQKHARYSHRHLRRKKRIQLGCTVHVNQRREAAERTGKSAMVVGTCRSGASEAHRCPHRSWSNSEMRSADVARLSMPFAEGVDPRLGAASALGVSVPRWENLESTILADLKACAPYGVGWLAPIEARPGAF